MIAPFDAVQADLDPGVVADGDEARSARSRSRHWSNSARKISPSSIFMRIIVPVARTIRSGTKFLIVPHDASVRTDPPTAQGR